MDQMVEILLLQEILPLAAVEEEQESPQVRLADQEMQEALVEEVHTQTPCLQEMEHRLINLRFLDGRFLAAPEETES
jgi:hypothetical protein